MRQKLFNYFNFITWLISNIKIFFFPSNGQMVIVTGASSNHFQSLLQLLESIEKFESATKCIVYDLGLTKAESKELSRKFPQYSVKMFEYSNYPAHVNININAGSYAWKPLIIKEVFENYDCKIIWLDSGDLLLKRLRFLRKYLNCYGFYSAYSIGTIEDWTHPSTLSVMGVDRESLRLRNLSANIIGLNPKFNGVKDLIHSWSDLASKKEVIAPLGSSRENHRQDQSLLTILAHRMNLAPLGNRGNFHRRIIGLAMHQDVEGT